MIAISGWQWALDHRSDILSRFIQHVELTGIAVAIGVLISFPLAVLAYRRPRFYPPITSVASVLYTIPSLAFITLLIPLTGFKVPTVEVPLVAYTQLILIRNIVAGLRGVSEDAKDAALGMGYSRRQLLWRVEVPLGLPAIIAGIRITTVSTIGLITIAALIGKGGLGQFILAGLQTFFYFEIAMGVVLSIALALVADVLLLGVGKILMPWTRRTRTPRAMLLPRAPTALVS